MPVTLMKSVLARSFCITAQYLETIKKWIILTHKPDKADLAQRIQVFSVSQFCISLGLYTLVSQQIQVFPWWSPNVYSIPKPYVLTRPPTSLHCIFRQPILIAWGWLQSHLYIPICGFNQTVKQAWMPRPVFFIKYKSLKHQRLSHIVMINIVSIKFLFHCVCVCVMCECNHICTGSNIKQGPITRLTALPSAG